MALIAAHYLDAEITLLVMMMIMMMMKWCLMSSDVGWHIRDKLWPKPKQHIFTSTEARRLVRTDSPGRPPRLAHLPNYAWLGLFFFFFYIFIFILVLVLASRLLAGLFTLLKVAGGPVSTGSVLLLAEGTDSKLSSRLRKRKINNNKTSDSTLITTTNVRPDITVLVDRTKTNNKTKLLLSALSFATWCWPLECGRSHHRVDSLYVN